MRIFSWNCRVLGRPRTVRALKEAIRVFRPQVVGLMETKKRTVGWDRVKMELGFQNCFVVGREGLSGGMAVLWNSEAELEIISFSKSHVNAVLQGKDKFRLTLFYGEPVCSNRKRSWELLSRLCMQSDLPWVVMGDFNEIVCLKEVWGRGGHSNWQINNFRQALDDCQLSDLGFIGSPFTYSNRRKGIEEMRGRLDRAVCTWQWRQEHPKGQVHHLDIHVSDHCIIMLDTDGEYGGKSKRPFRFEAMWLEHPEFSKVIRNVWNTSSGHRDSWDEILKLCQEKLKVWNSSTFGNVQGIVKGLKNRLEVIKTLVRTDDVVEEEGRLSEELDQWLLREEVLWLQRSQISWLKFGDRNTKFLHACANQRRKKNWIKELRDNRGNRFSDKNKLTSMATDYFNEIFRPSYTDDVVDWSRQLVCLQPVISEEMNRGLLEDISEEEVRRAVFNMSPLKAPGVDGFPALFYQKNWGNIRGYVMAYVRELWMNGVLEDRLNKTLIVLIPKKKDADRMEDLRPISLCTVAMKIITKILAARLLISQYVD
ncbi:unnamed protein product [Rhodiola kirilowii]